MDLVQFSMRFSIKFILQLNEMKFNEIDQDGHILEEENTLSHSMIITMLVTLRSSVK